MGKLRLVDVVDGDQAIGKPQRRFHRVGQALLLRGLHLEAVDHHVDVVLDLLLQLRRVRELVNLAVDAHAGKALGRHVREKIHELALALAGHRSEHLELELLLVVQDRVHNLLRRLRLDDRVALRAVRRAGAGEQQTQKVVDLGDGAHRGPRVVVGGLLVDGHGRREAIDVVGVGLVHLAQKHPRVGAQRFHVAALTFGEDGVEGQRRLAGSGQPGEHDHLVAWDVDVYPFEVVLTCAAHN